MNAWYEADSHGCVAYGFLAFNSKASNMFPIPLGERKCCVNHRTPQGLQGRMPELHTCSLCS